MSLDLARVSLCLCAHSTLLLVLISEAYFDETPNCNETFASHRITTELKINKLVNDQRGKPDSTFVLR
jgi:hypothetical protein